MKRKNGPWTITGSELKYENPWISVREDRVVLLSGHPGLFGVVTMLAGATVIALDRDQNVYLTREFKYAVERNSVEVISGGIDEGESPLEAAKRELKEEAGLSSEHWTDLGAIDPFTTIISSTNHIFLAEQVVEGDRKLDHNEKIDVTKVSLAKAVEMAMSGEITHGASVAAILKAKIFLETRRS